METGLETSNDQLQIIALILDAYCIKPEPEYIAMIVFGDTSEDSIAEIKKHINDEKFLELANAKIYGLSVTDPVTIKGIKAAFATGIANIREKLLKDILIKIKEADENNVRLSAKAYSIKELRNIFELEMQIHGVTINTSAVMHLSKSLDQEDNKVFDVDKSAKELELVRRSQDRNNGSLKSVLSEKDAAIVDAEFSEDAGLLVVQ